MLITAFCVLLINYSVCVLASSVSIGVLLGYHAKPGEMYATLSLLRLGI